MKKNDIIELLQIKLNGGSITPDVWKTAHPIVIEKYASMAFNTLFYNLFRKDLSNYELYSKWYLDVSIDRSGSRPTSTLPIAAVQTPNKGDCVRDIVYVDDDLSITFAPTTVHEYKRLNALGTAGRNGIIGYVLNSNQITYFGLPEEITEVDLYLLRSFESFGRNEDVPVPQGKENEFFQMMLNYLSPIKPIDLNNNNTTT